ncbi:MAG TPA: Hsp70 family protein [Stellaceae bacterium]|nr:Hsp70 family protein [Stellaceae bacterium]
MKLFQIEEPDGSPLEAEGPGLAVGIAFSPGRGAAVAVAVGGNAEILPGAEGSPRLALPAHVDEASLAALLLALRERAEKTLARPVTHAVIAIDAPADVMRPTLTKAASSAGLVLLDVLPSAAAAALAKGAEPGDAPALGAAIKAEDAAAALPPAR